MGTEIYSTQVGIKNENRWNSLLIGSFHGSYRASMAYEYTKRNIGREAVTFIFQRSGEDIAGAHFSIKRSKNGILTTADILSGIVFKHSPEKESLKYILNHFLFWAKANKASFIRINPWLPVAIDGIKPGYTEMFESELMEFGFKQLNNPTHTYWIDLTQSEEKLLMNMNAGTRSKIKKALKAKIESEINDKPDKIIINRFWELYSKLGTRKGFEILPEDRFKEEVSSLLLSNLALLFVLRFEGVIINIALASKFGHSMYFHGALNPDYKSMQGCPSPGHLAQWEIIKYLKSAGLEIYDMAFCPGAVPVNNHPEFDIWRFKYGFGGKHVQYAPVYGKVLDPIRGNLFKLIRYHG